MTLQGSQHKLSTPISNKAVAKTLGELAIELMFSEQHDMDEDAMCVNRLQAKLIAALEVERLTARMDDADTHRLATNFAAAIGFTFHNFAILCAIQATSCGHKDCKENTRMQVEKILLKTVIDIMTRLDFELNTTPEGPTQ